jgi:hypothetical protein
MQRVTRTQSNPLLQPIRANAFWRQRTEAPHLSHGRVFRRGATDCEVMSRRPSPATSRRPSLVENVSKFEICPALPLSRRSSSETCPGLGHLLLVALL